MRKLFIKSFKLNKKFLVSIISILLIVILSILLFYSFANSNNGVNTSDISTNSLDSNHNSSDDSNSNISNFRDTSDNNSNDSNNSSSEKKDFIKWVDFNVTSEAMKLTSKLDIESHNSDSEIKYNWIELLAYLASQNGGNFKNFKKSDLDNLVTKLNNGESISDLTSNMKFYDYYYEAYSAVLSGFIGNYSIEAKNSSISDENNSRF